MKVYRENHDEYTSPLPDPISTTSPLSKTTTSTQNSSHTTPNILARGKPPANTPKRGLGGDIAFNSPSSNSSSDATSDNESTEVDNSQTHHQLYALQVPPERSLSRPHASKNGPSTTLASVSLCTPTPAQHAWLQSAHPLLDLHYQQGPVKVIPGIPSNFASSAYKRVENIPLLPGEVWGLRSLSPAKRHHFYHGLVSWGLSMLQNGHAHPLYPEFWELIVTHSEQLIHDEMQWLAYHLHEASEVQQDRHTKLNTFRQQQAQAVHVDDLGFESWVTKLSHLKPPGEAAYLASLRQTASLSVATPHDGDVPPQTDYPVYQTIFPNHPPAGDPGSQLKRSAYVLNADEPGRPSKQPRKEFSRLTQKELNAKAKIAEDQRAKIEAGIQEMEKIYEERKEEIDRWWEVNRAAQHRKPPSLWEKFNTWAKDAPQGKRTAKKSSPKSQRKAPATTAATPTARTSLALPTDATPETAGPGLRDCGNQEPTDDTTWIRHNGKQDRYICNHKLNSADCDAETCTHKCCKEGLDYKAKKTSMKKKKYVKKGTYNKREAFEVRKARMTADLEAEQQKSQAPAVSQPPALEEIAANKVAEDQSIAFALEEHDRKEAIAREVEAKKQWPNMDGFEKWWKLSRQRVTGYSFISVDDEHFLRSQEPSARKDWNWNWKAEKEQKEAQEKDEANAAAAAAQSEVAIGGDDLEALFYEDEDNDKDEELFGPDS
jgi:hypothetical protein